MTSNTKDKIKRNTNAKFEQALLIIDDFELICLNAGNTSKIIAVSIRNISKNEYFGVKISNKMMNEYIEEKFDLRYLFMNPDKKSWYLFNISDYKKEISLSPQELNNIMIQKYVPDTGFFSRCHSEDYKFTLKTNKSVQRLNVDGQWDMNEFSILHSNISDLYSLSKSIDDFLDDQETIDKKKRISNAFSKPWEGGGSYYGFFRSMSHTTGAKPKIKAIQWASPGYIDITGDEKTFDKIIELLKLYSEKTNISDTHYKELWSYLKDSKLLNKSSKNLDKKSSTAKEVSSRARKLCNSLKITDYSTIKKMSGDDPVVAAKVLLATKRRMDKLFTFFAEGRVTIPESDIKQIKV